jgi:uncharacterized membrane protein
LPKCEHRYIELLLIGALLMGACAGVKATSGASGPPAQPDAPTPHAAASCPAEPVTVAEVRPLVDKYCVSCHSPDGAAGEDYDFRTDASISARRRNIEAKLRLHAMPPPNVHQPSEAERTAMWCWAKS